MSTREAMLQFLLSTGTAFTGKTPEEIVSAFEREVRRTCAEEIRAVIESGEVTEMQRDGYACGCCNTDTALEYVANMIDPDKEIS